jgi:hypothetical protein
VKQNKDLNLYLNSINLLMPLKQLKMVFVHITLSFLYSIVVPFDVVVVVIECWCRWRYWCDECVVDFCLFQTTRWTPALQRTFPPLSRIRFNSSGSSGLWSRVRRLGNHVLYNVSPSPITIAESPTWPMYNLFPRTNTTLAVQPKRWFLF